MEIKQVAEVLILEGLKEPTLNALVPNVDNYTVLLMQPQGRIEASTIGVRNQDRNLALKQYGRFLTDAQQTNADLVITPEYSMPWETLVTAIREGTVPEKGKIWALGCESIRVSDLDNYKRSLSSMVSVIYEQLDSESSRFVSPLAYVFNAPLAEGSGVKTTLLIQFKTYPMGDSDHFEVSGMQRGTQIYQFGGNNQSLRLVSLICSDAFAFEDSQAALIYDRALILHLQLNPSPRHEEFHECRTKLLRYSGDATEVLCLNWARDVFECCGTQTKSWNNIAGTAWYLKSHDFDKRDTTLCNNHQKGLYYTWLAPLRTHALFFNFEAATYLLEATKVYHYAVSAPTSRRRGPQLKKICTWNQENETWNEQAAADDGFSVVVSESGYAKDNIKRIADSNPLEAERILALCAGEIANTDEWHTVNELDSCIIDASEVICRLTFCQDTDERAHDFRIARLKRCGRLWDILKTDDQLPPALEDFKDGFYFEWSPNSPHQNAISTSGKRATVIYMGEESSIEQVEATAKKVAEYIHRASSDINQSLSAKQRLAVWFRENNEIILYDYLRYVRIDQTGDTSEFDIGRET